MNTHIQKSNFLLMFIFIFVMIVAGSIGYTFGAKQNQSIYLNQQQTTICPKNQTKLRTFDSISPLHFKYPIGWQILSMGDVGSISEGFVNQEFYKDTFGSLIERLDTIDINFEYPHDIGPYDRSVDVQIKDMSFKKPLITTAQEYIKKIEKTYGQGSIEKYSSLSQVNFIMWFGSHPLYGDDGGKYLLYVTDYTDSRGQKHFVEISREGDNITTMKQDLKQIIDSFRIEPK